MFVECNADEALVRYLTGLSRRQINHELKGKAAICIRLSNGRDEVGMVDEDPDSVQPPYLRSIRLSEDLTNHGIRVYEDDPRRNRLVVLCPRLEEWIIRTVQDAGLSMGAYGLPDSAITLHRVINYDLRKLQRLLEALSSASSIRLNTLQGLLI